MSRVKPRQSDPARRDLEERVKELKCLYEIAQLSGQRHLSLREVLEGVTSALPGALQFPQKGRARILLDGVVYAAAGDGPGKVGHAAPVMVNGRPRGEVQVGYPEEGGSRRLILQEERRLLAEVARQVSLVIEHREAEENEATLREQLRHVDRLAMIGQLASGVAHELNEPLGSILGFAQLLGKSTRRSPQVRQDVAKIEAAALRAREVIRKLMTFARQQAPHYEWVDVNELLRENMSLWRMRAEEYDIRVVCSCDPALPRIMADAGQIGQVVTNLALNALQAMADGGTLAFKTRRCGPWVELRVEDTGSGIPTAVLPRIFDPFFTTKDIDQGTGLGLAVTHGIVTAHGGTIRAENRRARGTRFTVRLPVRRSDVPGENSGMPAP